MAILGLTALALVAATGRVLTEAEDLREEGALVFAEADFQESSPVRFLREIDDGTEVYSNVPDGLWFAGVDGARPVPITFDPLSFHESPILDDELARLRSEVESGAVIFYYHPAESSYYLVSLADLEEIAPCIVDEDDLGVVLVDDDNPLCET
jgi:hypothetical protein